MKKLLKDFKEGEKGVVSDIVDGIANSIKRRLFDMGITPGVEIVLQKIAPLGDPIQISLRGYSLSLRKSEAEFITMEVKE